MKVPSVTDEMLGKVLECAASPVIVEWWSLEDPSRHRKRHVLGAGAEEFDDRFIFLRILIEEHPEAFEHFVRCFRVPRWPGIAAVRKGELVGNLTGDWDGTQLEELFRAVLERRP